MTHPGSSRRHRAGLVLGALALIAAGLAVSAYSTGGFRIHVLGVPVSVRGELRPALVALFLTMGSLHLLNAGHSRFIARIAGLLPRAAPWMAFAAGLAVLAIGIQNVSTAASASDPSGYVSQAGMWLQGDLRARQPDVARRAWPDAPWTFVPLGYRPDYTTQTIVPPRSPLPPALPSSSS